MDIGILRRDGRTDGFFDAAARDRLAVRLCGACSTGRDAGRGAFLPPDATSCPDCGTEDLEWADASGEAVLITWTILHGRPAEDGTTPPPALLGLVELAEGPWMHARLDGVDAAGLREGLPLRARFAHPDEGESYPLFLPV
ncbi:Zn-ribbon domain-containing OB-fold protein [Actinomadura oligospora]|uniref:Zn-ribbon domain-containing OB-fold protein n=1 Tax=Actinomadura oligospora TaxID=111804 RepID=UPI0004BCE20E|nr:OB-fold domain-containing protein [Actinomadura oligospora]